MALEWSGLPSWRALKVQHKVWAVLLLVCLPLLGGTGAHLYVVQHLLATQQHRHDVLLARHHVDGLRRLTIDIEDAFRGYVLTSQSAFLTPLVEAETKLDDALRSAREAIQALSTPAADLTATEYQLKDLLRSKHELIRSMEEGRPEQALSYVRSGQGLKLSDSLRRDLRTLEDQLDDQLTVLNDRASTLSHEAFYGLWIALAGVLVLGTISSVMLARAVTRPIEQLEQVTGMFGTALDSQQVEQVLTPLAQSPDEFGRLAVSYVRMADRIATHLRELEVLSAIGHEINRIGPDGLDGVLQRITDRAVELTQTDVCLVLCRHEQMHCWVVESASGVWNDHLKKSVMLWEELPVSVQAFETLKPAIGNRLRADQRPQVIRRNLIGDSMLAIPLLAQGMPFGVLALLNYTPRSEQEWNVRLAAGLAQEAALAISNSRLFEAAQEKQRDLRARLRHLEHLAETLAHDLKGPGERTEELASLLERTLGPDVDPKVVRWLTLIRENGQDMVQRVEGLLSIARVGTDSGAITAVDPTLVLNDVLKALAGELERAQASVTIEASLPLVACHPAYLRQIFDNLISNALKYARQDVAPAVSIACTLERDHMACFSVCDHGIGIPPERRARVFEPFVRLRSSTAPGSGIGLTIVERIVALYGGRIWIEETPGGGCTVKFTLPRLQSDNTAPRPESSLAEDFPVERHATRRWL